MQVTRAWVVKEVAGALLLAGGAVAAVAAPAGGAVQAGTASIASTSTTTTITQSSTRAVIDWQSFSIAAGQSVTFTQPSAQSATLNRVTGNQLSDIEGSLSANGQVFLVNPNGILIGKGANVDTGTFVATTANIANNSFMTTPASPNGQYAFNQVTTASGSGTIVNNGAITAADGGLVALVAPAVRNSGVITARLGRIELASANIFTLDLYGDDLIRLAVSDQVAGTLKDVGGQPVSAQVSVDGQLHADGGRIVLLSAPAAAGILDAAINLSGVARAQTVAANQQGQIQLLATAGNVSISGTLDATAPAAVSGTALPGGSIDVDGAAVHVLSGARVDASGPGGGGFVALGGTLSYGNQTLQTGTTTVDYGAFVGACGTATCAADGSGGSGNGGTVRLYSMNGTQLSGELNVSSAQGAVAGTVEVLSNLGTTSLGTMAQIFANTGTGQKAGFAVVIGNELAVASGVRMDMRDYAGNEPDSTTHVLYDASDPALRTYVLSNDPKLTTLQTNFPIVFHAYDPNAQATYVSQLPPLNDGIEASGYLTPVGTVRPNGGAPTTMVSTAADPLTPIEVSLTPPPVAPPPAPPESTPPGGDTGSDPNTLIQVVAASGRVAQQTNDISGEAPVSAGPAVGAVAAAAPGATGALPVVAGGPGVAQIADLGRGGTSGASPDVFNVNYQVVAPAGGVADAPLADYLCTTPFARNGCRGHDAGR